MWVEGMLACLVERTLPESVEVGRALGGRLQFLRRERRGAQPHIVFPVDMGSDLETIETWLAHRTGPLHRAVFQRHTLALRIGIHHRTCLEVDSGVGQQGARLAHVDHETGFLSRAVVPVLVVGGYADHDIITSNLSTGAECQGNEEEGGEYSFHFLLRLGLRRSRNILNGFFLTGRACGLDGTGG